MKGKIEIKYRGHFFADEGNIRGRERERETQTPCCHIFLHQNEKGGSFKDDRVKGRDTSKIIEKLTLFLGDFLIAFSSLQKP